MVNFIMGRVGVLFLRENVGRWAFLYIALLASCASQPNMNNSGQINAQEVGYEAAQLLQNEDYAKAADLFLRLAKEKPLKANFFRLQAAQARFDSGQDEQARVLADSVQVNSLNNRQRNQLHLLYAQIYLNSGDAERAIKRLHLVTDIDLTQVQKQSYHEAKAFSYALNDKKIESVRERITLNHFLVKKEDKLRNQKAIMALLGLVPLALLEEQIALQPKEDYLGWLDLAIISRLELKGTVEFESLINQWEGRYLFHSAHELVASGYFINTQLTIENIRNIAIFLPESGRYAEHAKAVKEGFMAAYYQQDEAMRPNVRFYDTEVQAIGLVYQQAEADGAELIIGPLNKVKVAELSQLGKLNIPVLALNYVEELSRENIYQFALNPMDEVNQAVEAAKLAGFNNALILAPDGAVGERIATYFQNAWELVGGNVLVVQKFNPQTSDFSQPVKAMLSVAESEYRYSKLKNISAGLKFNSRRRRDVDVIFMVANYQQARLINPHFYHNRAEGVAVYGLSRVYTGRQDDNKNIDLNGVNFCSIPWLFEGAYQGELNMQALQSTWQQFPDKFLSLIAFGIDAYDIVPYLNKLKTMQYQGVTGELSVNESNVIVRKLVCAKFQKGLAQLVTEHEAVLAPHININQYEGE